MTTRGFIFPRSPVVAHVDDPKEEEALQGPVGRVGVFPVSSLVLTLVLTLVLILVLSLHPPPPQVLCTAPC